MSVYHRGPDVTVTEKLLDGSEAKDPSPRVGVNDKFASVHLTQTIPNSLDRQTTPERWAFLASLVIARVAGKLGRNPRLTVGGTDEGIANAITEMGAAGP